MKIKKYWRAAWDKLMGTQYEVVGIEGEIPVPPKIIDRRPEEIMMFGVGIEKIRGAFRQWKDRKDRGTP